MNTSTGTRPAVNDATVDHSADVAAIERLVADVQDGFNTNDAELMVSGFTANAVAGNAVGMLITGYQELLEASEAGLAGFLREEYVRDEISDVTFLRPDVALAHKTAQAATATGELIDREPAMVAVYVLVREQDRWWVAARHNTLVPRSD